LIAAVEPGEGREPPWVDLRVAKALRTVEMPPQSLALYARWWQLETWLRELVYVELRALRGTAWSDAVKAAEFRRTIDAQFRHMAGVDSDNPLAYLDYSQLIEVITGHWPQFGYALLEQKSWEGRQAELRQIRHRIGHLRTPHRDDLARVEQTLRDLEDGTFLALASYNRRHGPSLDKNHDPVTVGWIAGQHEDARRLLDHADKQYETRVSVATSRRPWVSWQESLDGAAGVLWHVNFYMRGRAVEASALWHHDYVAAVRPLIVHMLADGPQQIGFTFSAVDDGAQIADAIGKIFDAILMTSDYRSLSSGLTAALQEDDAWRARARQIDYRVLTRTGWNILDETTLPISNFGAGGVVESVPAWPSAPP
jgi:hypothetical protein